MKTLKLNPKVLVTIWFLASSIFIYSQKIADFSGDWILNKSLSKSLLTQIESSSIIISQDSMRLTMDITLTPVNQKPIKRTEKYLLNSSIATKSVNKSRRIDTHLAPDGQSFTITETITFTKDSFINKSQRVDIYSLSKDGKTLTIKTDDILPKNPSTPEKERQETRVYNKKIK